MPACDYLPTVCRGGKLVCAIQKAGNIHSNGLRTSSLGINSLASHLPSFRGRHHVPGFTLEAAFRHQFPLPGALVKQDGTSLKSIVTSVKSASQLHCAQIEMMVTIYVCSVFPAHLSPVFSNCPSSNIDGGRERDLLRTVESGSFRLPSHLLPTATSPSKPGRAHLSSCI